MTAGEIVELMLHITGQEFESGDFRNSDIRFDPGDDGPYSVNDIYLDDDGDLCIESNEEDDEEYNITQIGNECSVVDEDTYVYFKVVDEDGEEYCYNISEDWDFDDDGMVIVDLYDIDSDEDSDEDEDDDEDDDDDGDDDDDNNGGEYSNTKSVEFLKEILSSASASSLREHLYVDDGDELSNVTINCIYPRNGEAVLQSNEIDLRKHSLSLDYILHCLEWFDDDDDLSFMYCDEDNDYSFYDICGYHFDNDDNLVLEIEER